MPGPMKRILVGTDFSAAGTRAAGVALAWARRTGSALRIVHVVPPKRWLSGLWRTDVDTISAVHRHAGLALKRLAEALDSSRHIELSTGLVSGSASIEIARAARDFEADLLIIGARGEHDAPRGQSDLGGTSLKLLGTSATPLLLVRTGASGSPRMVLAAVDLSPVSKQVLRWARASSSDGRGVCVLHAYEAPFAARLEAYGIAKESIDLYSDAEHAKREHELDALISETADDGETSRIIERGDPVDVLYEHVRRLAPDLIVLGRKGFGGRRRPAQGAGGVSRLVASFAPVDMLIVPYLPA